VLERLEAGRVRIDVGGVFQATPAFDLSASVDSGSEKGLLGICLDPGFLANGRLYLYYTTLVPKNRISPFTMSGNSISGATEAVILDGIDATNGNHDGGTVAIGPDGSLHYAAIGSGKICRIDGLGATSYYTISPCRFLDVRLPVGPTGGPALSAGVSRTFSVAGHCGVPATARAVAASVTVTRPSADGSLAAYPASQAKPLGSVSYFWVGWTRASNAMLSLGPNGDFAASPEMVSGTVHLIVDAVGYFE
jgi:hypothetical protein